MIFSINHSVVMTLKRKHTSMRSWEARNSEQNYATEDPEMAGIIKTSTERVMDWDRQPLSLRSKTITSVSEASLVLSGHHLKIIPLSLTALPCSST